MYKHHKDSIKNMIEHYHEDPDVIALFLIGSVATNTERPDSDLDGVVVISKENYEKRVENATLEEVVRGKCTYEGGYFDVHYMSREVIEGLAASGAEPMRNMFSSARVLFCNDPDLPGIVAKIPVFQKSEVEKKRLNYYCTMSMFSSYFLKTCKAEGFMRLHIADGMIYNLYKLILLENEVLFPSMRKLELSVIGLKNKPEGIVEKCHELIRTLSEEAFDDILKSYREWTTYDYPKSGSVISNHFRDPYDWQ